MRVQQPRHDALPLTWEIPATICACWLLLGTLAVPAGLTATSWVAGHGWAWPERPLVRVLSDAVSGELGGGLPAALVYVLVVAFEVFVAAIAVLALVVWSQTWGPHAHHGLARRHEVAAVLGVGNLRRRRTTIRPDLPIGRRSGRTSE
jgi:hypothetical protein